MKIAILTQPLYANYGGLLQAYALQKTLRDFGHDAVTENGLKGRSLLDWLKYCAIRYAYPIVHKFRPDLGRYEKTVNNSKPIRVVVCAETSQFVNRHIKTVGYITREEAQNYDAFVVGSDQVWRPRYNSEPLHLFLDFARGLKVKRIAYAASFGTDKWEFKDADTLSCKELARMFDAISVREKSGVALCKDYLGVEAVHVVDPTMLLTADDYRKLIAETARQEKRNNTISTYILDETAEKRQAIDTAAKSLSCSVRNLFVAQKSADGKPQTAPGVEKWLSGIANADYVITDSFHGTVFSILFNRPFMVIANAKRGTSRMESLLDSLGLKERLALTPDVITAEKLQSPIDWTSVNQKLETQRTYSINFLNDCGL